MKKCPVCALDLEDSFLFCPDDGSSLGHVSSEPMITAEASSALAATNETVSPVVLYCPTCAAEYPLTFSECPVHGTSLVSHKIPRPSAQKAAGLSSATLESEKTTNAPLRLVSPKRSNRLTSLDLERPQIDNLRLGAVAVAEGSAQLRPAQVTATAHDDIPLEASEAVFPESDAGEPESQERAGDFPEVHRHESERPGFRVAAIVTIAVLALLGIAALYSLISYMSRRASSPAARVGGQTETAQALPFIPTPQEALDYTEPQPAAAASPAEEPSRDAAIERKRDIAHPLTTDRSARVAPLDQPAAKPAPPPVAAPPRIANVSSPPLPLPRGGQSGFDARLVRVRSRATPSGVRYDMTFNMQDQAGHFAQWQRLLINSRSASGISHTEAIPFVHRLGATGGLTFTVSVEMSGRSESDRQGRVVCTALGWDNKGAPLQASFGANLSP